MDKRTEATISKLQQELELSAFLNKGVLSSNQEQKVRIAELEGENAVLRTTESKLAALEDAYAEQEKRMQRAEGALADARRRAASHLTALKGAQEGCTRAEADAARWRGKYQRLAAAVAQATSLFEDAEAADPEPARERFTLALPGSNTAPPATAAASSRASQVSRSLSPHPSMRPRKRIRVSDDNDDDSTGVPPPTARMLFTKSVNGKRQKEPSAGEETSEEETPSPQPQVTVTAKTRAKVPADDNVPLKSRGKTGTGVSVNTPPITRQKGRHSSPLPRRAVAPKAPAPATAPRTRRQQPEPLPEPKFDVKSEPESDSDPLDRWDD